MFEETVLIFDWQNVIETLRSEGKEISVYQPLIIAALRDINENTIPWFCLSSTINLFQVAGPCFIVKAEPQIPGKEDVVDKWIKTLIQKAAETEGVSSIILVSGDQKHLRSSIKDAVSLGKDAILFPPEQIIKILGKEGGEAETTSQKLREAMESESDPFPNIVLKLQNDIPITPEEKAGLFFLELVTKYLLEMYAEKEVVLFNELAKEIWSKCQPVARELDEAGKQKFTYYHCWDTLLALLTYSDLLHQDKDEEGVRLDRESPLLAKLNPKLNQEQ